MIFYMLFTQTNFGISLFTKKASAEITERVRFKKEKQSAFGSA